MTEWMTEWRNIMTTTSDIFDCSRQKICIHCPLSYLICISGWLKCIPFRRELWRWFFNSCQDLSQMWKSTVIMRQLSLELRELVACFRAQKKINGRKVWDNFKQLHLNCISEQLQKPLCDFLNRSVLYNGDISLIFSCGRTSDKRQRCWVPLSDTSEERCCDRGQLLRATCGGL